MQFARWCRFVSATSVAGTLLACAPSLNWRDVRPVHGQGLTLLFPCQPEHRQRDLTLPGVAGGPLTLHLLSCDADGATWALSYADAGTPQRWLQALPALSDALWSNVSMVRSDASWRRDLGATAVPGMTPHPASHTWWLQGQRPRQSSPGEAVQVQAWHFSKGLTVFQASVWGTALREGDPRIKAFASSFNFPP